MPAWLFGEPVTAWERKGQCPVPRLAGPGGMGAHVHLVSDPLISTTQLCWGRLF